MTPRMLDVKQSILGVNAAAAQMNRKLLDSHRVLMISLTSSPGSGKTSLLMRTIERLRERYRIAVVEAIAGSSIDADLIAGQNIPTVQIHASGACHLDAAMIRKGLAELDLHQLDLVFVENIGNLVCTADFDLGAHKNAVILSVPEGDDKPRKHPMIFLKSDAVLVSKIDVLPWFDFNLNAFSEVISDLNPAAKILPFSARTGEGMDDWFAWIRQSKEELNGGKDLQGAI